MGSGFTPALGQMIATQPSLTPLQEIAKRIKALNYRDLEKLRSALDDETEYCQDRGGLKVTHEGLLTAADALEA